MTEQFTPTLYTRHQRPLRAVLLESQVWFHAQDLGRLMGRQLDQRKARKLDSDQFRQVQMRCENGTQDTLIISESGAYALLVYHYAPENRALRRWLSQEVIPTMHARPQAPIIQSSVC
ncbi:MULTISPECIES: BRO-N domain-containing protein [unclassified Pseudomonas]|uniref:BRO-N domain-containing protein n=1 Tax=unclassified Pseudomonas TaxID=196821 RepID=UPI0025FF4C5D|nr:MULTISPECIES: Bro-N domain-containing protein [unclassified Pseudomonas]